MAYGDVVVVHDVGYVYWVCVRSSFVREFGWRCSGFACIGDERAQHCPLRFGVVLRIVERFAEFSSLRCEACLAQLISKLSKPLDIVGCWVRFHFSMQPMLAPDALPYGRVAPRLPLPPGECRESARGAC